METRILIIDDDPFQHEVLGDYLLLAGYAPFHAQSGEQGLRMLEETRPHMVLLDVQMPGLDGFQTLREIRKKAANRNISVLFLTALDKRHLKVKGLELGADDFIVKPFDSSELLARIKAVLRRSSCHRNLEGVMEGDLSDVGLADLLQSMELGMKTATITVEELDAEILVDNGELVHLRMGGFSGEDAMVRILLVEKGFFSIRFNDLPENAPRAPRPITAFLMRATGAVDEVKDVIRKIRAENRRISISGDVSRFPEIDEIRHLAPMTFVEMVVAMKRKPMENIKILVAASKGKLLKIEK